MDPLKIKRRMKLYKANGFPLAFLLKPLEKSYKNEYNETDDELRKDDEL